MDISSINMENMRSLQNALGMVTLRKALNQDSQTVSTLLQDMQITTAKIMENSVTPYKGSNIDISV